jgi:hypothetical protein
MAHRIAGAVALLLGVAFVPAARAQVQTGTDSSGTIYVQNYAYTGQRNDAYQTRITASIDGIGMLFDQTFFRGLGDPSVQAAFADASQPRGYARNGAPGVLVWDAPELVESWEEFVDSLTEYYVVVDPTVTYVTVQTTDGDYDNALVYFGDRGACYDAGSSGSTNSPPYDGAFANCDSWEEAYVPPGTINTNTHTTTVYSTTEVTFTQEDWLNYSHWNLSGRVELIGHAYPALQGALFDAGTGLLGRLGVGGGGGGAQRAPTAPGSSWDVWLQGHRAQSRIAGDIAAPGHRHELSGGSAGLDYVGKTGWRFGVALDRSDLDLAVHGAPEQAQADLVQFGVHGAYDNGAWFMGVAAAHGRGDATTRHGDDVLGGVSSAGLDVAQSSIGVHAGVRTHVGKVSLSPGVGIDWTRQRTDAWSESGGIALRSDGYTATRRRAWLGLEATRQWDFGNGRVLVLAATGRIHSLLSGAARKVPVAFVDTPDEDLAIAGVRDAGDSRSLEVVAALRLSRHAALQFGAEAWRAGGDRGERWVAAFRVDW